MRGRPVWLFVLGVMGCSALYREDPCGRQRSVTASGPIAGAQPADSNASVTLIEEDSRLGTDGLSWNIPVSLEGDSVTAVHLHDLTPGHGERVVYILPDFDPGPGFALGATTDYSHTTSIETLFQLVRSGQTYLDIHTASHPEGTARADLTAVQFEDWSGYYCS
jgi:CHRD domain-containing protein